MPRLAIIGAGAAGLACARALRARRPELEVTIYEQGRVPGGRVLTGRRDGCAFDHGAQVIKAPTPEMERLLAHELPAAELRRVTLPVWVFDASGALAPGDPAQGAEASYCYRGGNDRLGALLAEGLTIHFGVGIARMKCKMQSATWTPPAILHFALCTEYELYDDTGAQVGAADAVLLTPPAPRSAAILAASELDTGVKERLGAELARAAYRPCISIALAYDARVERPFSALLNVDRAHPVAWLGLEHLKAPERCPPGHSLLVAQMAPGWSRERWDAPNDAIGRAAAALVSGLLGQALGAPLWWDIRRWRDALPDAGCDAAALDGTGTGLFFAGDALAGQGRVHLAVASGRRAAEEIAAHM